MKQIFTMAVCLLGTLAPLQAADKKAETKAPTTADLNVTEFSGKVAETMNVASYTYVLVDTGAQKRWAAAPRFEVKTGDTVKIADAMAMENYQSKTLNRTFDVIYFTGSVTVNGKAPTRASAPPSSSAGGPLPAGHPPVAGAAPQGQPGSLPAGHPPIGGAPAAPATGALPSGHPAIGSDAQTAKDIKVKKADGGKTIAEIYAGYNKLNGKKVAVRGQVVKYNDGIMDRNWIHLQDGTGRAGANDLLVTSKQETKVGDTIVATGTIAANKNFGSGYKYLVLIEDAQIVKE